VGINRWVEKECVRTFAKKGKRGGTIGRADGGGGGEGTKKRNLVDFNKKKTGQEE